MKAIIFFSSILVSISAFAQLNTYTGNVGFVMNPSFLGPNYQLSNIQYTGQPHAIGSFISDSTNLGFQKGVVMTTGLIEGENSPVGPNDKFNAGFDNGYAGTPFVFNPEGDTYNAAVLEFDMYTFIDTIQFRYIFGSDEYPEYVGSQFNDQFRIFIEGPGIDGRQDLNYIPSGVYAGINTINAQANSSLYVENGDGNSAPYNSSDYYIQYDGFTVPLWAKIGVQANQTYHVTIAIADLSDGYYDSGVFLEQCETCDYNASTPTALMNQIECFPNPSHGDVSLSFPELTSAGELRIVDFSGRIIRTSEVLKGSSEFFVSDLPQGSFIVEISTENSLWRGKVSVE